MSPVLHALPATNRAGPGMRCVHVGTSDAAAADHRILRRIDGLGASCGVTHRLEPPALQGA